MATRLPIPSARARSYLTKMVVGQMTSTVSIERPGAPTFNATTGAITGVKASDLWSGPARIYGTRGSLTSLGDGVVSLGQTNISIPQTAPLPHVDDIVTVTFSPDDPALTGRRYRIVDVTEGGILSPMRVLTVTTVEGSPWT